MCFAFELKSLSCDPVRFMNTEYQSGLIQLPERFECGKSPGGQLPEAAYDLLLPPRNAHVVVLHQHARHFEYDIRRTSIYSRRNFLIAYPLAQVCW
jgi:hypothetical protein